MSLSTDNQPVEGRVPSAAVPIKEPSAVYQFFATYFGMVRFRTKTGQAPSIMYWYRATMGFMVDLTVLVGLPVLAIAIASYVIPANVFPADSSSTTPQFLPTVQASQPAVSPAAVTYSTDPVERGKQCVTAGAATTTARATVEAIYNSWSANLMAAQKSHSLDQLSCAFYEIDSKNAAWAMYSGFTPATTNIAKPFYMDGSGTISGNILSTLSVQTIMADGRGAIIEVTLRWSAAGGSDQSKGVWMASDTVITYGS